MAIKQLFERDLDGEAWAYRDQLEAEFVFVAWPDYSMPSIDDFIEGRQKVALSDDAQNELLEMRHCAFQAFKDKNIDLMTARLATLDQACRRYGMLDLAKLGARFSSGRKPGTGGPIRKAIARLLAKNPKAKNAELWESIKEKPPRGWTAMENRAGKYIEGPRAGDGMKYERFCTIASEERNNLKA